MKKNNQGAIPKKNTKMQRTSRIDPVHGSLYQLKLLMLFLYRGVSHKYSFSLGTEIKEAKKFDDLVFEYSEGGKTVYRLLQAKHRLDETKKITADDLLTDSDGDYSLTKYFFSYQDCKNEKLFKTGSIKDVTICTNINFDFKHLESNKILVDKIEDEDDILDVKSNLKQPMRYRINEDVTSILKPILQDYHLTRLARRLAECILNNKFILHYQKEDVFNIYHIALSEEIIDVNNNKFRDEFIENKMKSEDANKFRKAFIKEIENKSKPQLTLENINEAIIKSSEINNKQVGLNLSKNFGRGEDTNWPIDVISDDQIKDYFKHLVFAVNQPNEEELGKIINDEIGKGLKLDINTTENVYNKFFMKMLGLLQGKMESRFLSYKDGNNIFKEIIRGVPICFNVINPVALFTGRKQELRDLHSKIQRNSDNPTTVISQTTTISGLGGIGKTELARQYIYEHINDYDDVIWINAETERTLYDSFSRLAQDKLKISTQKYIESYVEDVYTFFAKRNSLFVFDNAENNMDINKFLPRFLTSDSKLYVLITSRNQEWDEGIEVIKLDELTPEDAIEFVKKGLTIKDDSQDLDIISLINKLQRFPLVIQQAIAYIKDQRVTEEFEINNYIIEFEKQAKVLLKSKVFRGIGNDYAKTTYTTWHITIHKISHEQNGPLALKILEVIAYFSPEKINREIFLNLAGVNNKQLQLAVRLLVKYSMVNKKSNEQKQRVLSVHRLVQQVTRLELKEQNYETKIIEEAYILLTKSCPIGDRSEYYSIRRQLLPHLEVFLSHMNDWCKKNPKHKRRVYKNYINDLEDMLSDIYYNEGDFHKLKTLLETVLQKEMKQYGANHIKVAKTLSTLGLAYGGLGDTQKEKILLERALKIEEKYYGSDHFGIVNSLVNLGNVYALSDPREQIKFLKRALKIQKLHYGCDHIKITDTLANLSIAYAVLGNPHKQIKLLEEALDMQKKHYGSDHFKIANTLVNLSIAYGALGDRHKQIKLLEVALEMQNKHYGSDHVKIANTLVNLSNAYGALGNPHKQLKLLERALQILEKHYGPDHFEIANILVDLSNAYEALGDYHKQMELLKEALEMQEKQYGSDHFEIAKTLVNLSNAYGNLGYPYKQIELIEQALEMQEKYYGFNHFEIAKTLVSLGNAYGNLGYPYKQIELLEKALEMQQKHYGSDNFEIANTLVYLGNAYGHLGYPHKQVELLERALEIQEKHYGFNHFEIAKTLISLGNAYGNLGYPHKEIELLERASKIKEKHFEVTKLLGHLDIADRDSEDPQKQL